MGEKTDARLVALVDKEAPFLAFTADKNKVLCTLNNHELPARMDAVEAFVKGKKYNRLKARKSTEDWADKYKPFLLPSVNFPNMMFCALTNHVIQKKQAVVEEHLKGRKFKMAQERFQNDQGDLFEEPTIAEMEAAIADEADRAAALEDASDDGSFEFEPMEGLVAEDAENDAENENDKRNDTHDAAEGEAEASTRASTKRKRKQASGRSNKSTKK